MKITRLTPAEGAAVASTLVEVVDLDGTYDLSPREGALDRYMLTPAEHAAGKFRVKIGKDPKMGRITLLQNDTEAVILLDATARPFGSCLGSATADGSQAGSS